MLTANPNLGLPFQCQRQKAQCHVVSDVAKVAKFGKFVTSVAEKNSLASPSDRCSSVDFSHSVMDTIRRGEALRNTRLGNQIGLRVLIKLTLDILCLFRAVASTLRRNRKCSL